MSSAEPSGRSAPQWLRARLNEWDGRWTAIGLRSVDQVEDVDAGQKLGVATGRRYDKLGRVDR